MFAEFLIRLLLITVGMFWLVGVAMLMSAGLWYWGIPLFSVGLAGLLTVMNT